MLIAGRYSDHFNAGDFPAYLVGNRERFHGAMGLWYLENRFFLDQGACGDWDFATALFGDHFAALAFDHFLSIFADHFAGGVWDFPDTMLLSHDAFLSG